MDGVCNMKKFFLLFFLSGLLSTNTYANERFHYKASYIGILSFFSTIDIADVYFSIASETKQQQLKKITLEVSSKNFSTVESLYQLRYFYQTILHPEQHKTLFFETLQWGKKNRHLIALFDADQSNVQLFKSNNKSLLFPDGSSKLPQLPLAQQHTELQQDAKMLELTTSVLDRLALLDEIRSDLNAGINEKKYQVTNGDELLDYHYKVLAEEQLKLGKHSIDAIKVELRGVMSSLDISNQKTDNNNAKLLYQQHYQAKNIHPPVIVWFSKDRQKIPLKFLGDRAIGDFVIEINPLQILAKQQLKSITIDRL